MTCSQRSVTPAAASYKQTTPTTLAACDCCPSAGFQKLITMISEVSAVLFLSVMFQEFV